MATQTSNAAESSDVADVLDAIGRSWLVVLALGLISILTGLIALVWPGATLVVVGAFFGAWLLVTGVVQLIQSFAIRDAGLGGRILLAISGVLSIVLGLLCFRSITKSLVILAIFIGIGWLFRGIAMVVAGVTGRGEAGRGFAIFFGVLSAIAGVILLVSPIESIGTLVWVSGIILIVLGLTEVFGAFRLRGALREAAALRG